MKPFAITLQVGSSLANKTGAWRTERPVYMDRLPPCNDACPAGENVQGWLYHAESGDYEQAWRTLTEDRLQAAQSQCLIGVYLLTTTAPEYFARLGFERVAREGVPTTLQQSSEFATVCPASAICR